MKTKSRTDRIDTLRKHPETSVLIVGAGINGIGTFRDLALQGVPVVLIDRGDYCSGASSASSHMIHGGIRYLENGEFRLVREAVRERNRLLENAPQLVKPLLTTVPIFRRFSGLLNAPFRFLGLNDRPAERGALVIKIGLVLYDWFTGRRRTVPPHIFRGRNESLLQFPALNPDILFTATYYDGLCTFPERLALDLLQDAVAEGDHAVALNYVSFVGFQAGAARLRDEITGEEFEVRPRAMVNAAGPWIDQINSATGQPTHFVGGTKGSHLVLDHPEFRAAIHDHEFFFENRDGRMVLILPLEDRVLVGTSDIPVEDADDVTITEDEIDYFLEMVKRVFPHIRIERSHIVFTFSGVRPLANGNNKTASQISRDHKIEVIEPNGNHSFPILSLVGGKWTTFRAFSEQVTDHLLQSLGRSRTASTAGLAIGPGHPMPSSPKDLKAIIANEDVVHLDDLVLRRTNTAMLGRATRQRIEELADLAADALVWNNSRKADEISRLEQLLRSKHGMNFTHYVGVTSKEVELARV